MEYSEGKTKARKQGTEQHNKFQGSIKNGLLVIGTLIVLIVATFWMTSFIYRERPPVAAEVAGGNENIASPPSSRVTLGLVPVDLTEGGTLGITWNLAVPGQCIKVYDNQMHYLGKDCEDGSYLDLTQRTPTFFAAANSEEVDIFYDTWRP